MTQSTIKILLCCIVLSFLYPETSQAFFWGEDEKIHKLMDIELNHPIEGELFLGYKTTSFFFGLGVYLKDDGYVLGVNDQSRKYIPMPSADELKIFKAQGLFPIHLPEYNISMIDYVWGYSLWVALLLSGIYQLIKHQLAQRKDLPAPLQENNESNDLNCKNETKNIEVIDDYTKNDLKISTKPKQPIYLCCLSGEYEGCEIELPPEGIIIGRDPEKSNLVINDTEISRAHVSITPNTRENEMVTIEDLHSVNGTYAKNGDDQWDKLPHGVPQETHIGRIFRIGNDVAVFQVSTTDK